MPLAYSLKEMKVSDDERIISLPFREGYRVPQKGLDALKLLPILGRSGRMGKWRPRRLLG